MPEKWSVPKLILWFWPTLPLINAHYTRHVLSQLYHKRESLTIFLTRRDFWTLAGAEVCYWRVSCERYIKWKKSQLKQNLRFLERFFFSPNRHEIKPNWFWQSYFEELQSSTHFFWVYKLFTPDPENLGKRYHLHINC